ncbi:hypothetical protein CKK33_02910 [Mucilaginibacter sp. MD40]|nr:hypothetical protein CKK33_02910 [Mucilaginibacter sp. MD40]
MNYKIKVAVSVTIVIINTLLDHWYPPSGLSLMPIAICATTALIGYGQGINRWQKVLLSYLFFAFTDIGIKLFGGGIHDSEGLGFVNVLSLTGLILATIILIIGLKPKKAADLLFGVLFIGFGVLHFLVFGELGLGISYI